MFNWLPENIFLYSIFIILAQVESGGNFEAYNEKENAAGVVQIRPIMVDEVNRILKLQKKKERYTLEDRYDPNKSFEIFSIYSLYWNHWHNDHTNEGMSRRWNGGPHGHTKKSTEVYWNKVLREMEKSLLDSLKIAS